MMRISPRISAKHPDVSRRSTEVLRLVTSVRPEIYPFTKNVNKTLAADMTLFLEFRNTVKPKLDRYLDGWTTEEKANEPAEQTGELLFNAIVDGNHADELRLSDQLVAFSVIHMTALIPFTEAENELLRWFEPYRRAMCFFKLLLKRYDREAKKLQSSIDAVRHFHAIYLINQNSVYYVMALLRCNAYRRSARNTHFQVCKFVAHFMDHKIGTQIEEAVAARAAKEV